MTHTSGQWAMTIVYCLLVVFWFTVLVKIDQILRHHHPPVPSTNYSQLQSAFRFVAIVLVIDSVYWAITNIARVGFIESSIEQVLRNPWLVALVKGLVLLSAFTFFIIVNQTISAIIEAGEWNEIAKIIDLTSDAIGILDESGRVVLWNRGAEELFGFTRDFTFHKNIKEFLVPPDLHHEIDSIFEEVKNSRERHRYNTYRLTRTGERIPVDVTTTPIYDRKLKGYFGIMRKAIPLPIADFRYFDPADSPPYKEAYVFVIMPFNLETVPADVYKFGIHDAITANGFRAVRGDDEFLTGPIMNQVFNSIRFASLIVADLSGEEPNVFYELGLAHLLGKTVIQLSSSKETLPFNIRSIRTIRYDLHDIDGLHRRLGDVIRRHKGTE